ncbi:hypothetical protein BGZ46_005977, partial [Entomortierella lignicola]
FCADYALELKTKITALNAGVVVNDLGLHEQKVVSSRPKLDNNNLEDSNYIIESESESEETEHFN